MQANIPNRVVDPQLLALHDEIGKIQLPEKTWDVFEVDVDDVDEEAQQRLFVLRRTLSLFLKHIRQKVPVSASTDVDIDRTTFDKTFGCVLTSTVVRENASWPRLRGNCVEC